MNIDGPLLSTIVHLALAGAAVLLGALVLWRGRRMPWLFSGAAAFLLAVLLVDVLDITLGLTDDTSRLRWEELIPLGAAVVGVLAGMFRIPIAYRLIGLASGAALALWLAQMVRPAGSGLDFISALVVLAVTWLGMLFVVHYGAVAIILLSVGVGIGLIVHGLALPLDSLLVAAFMLVLGIASLVIQYHDYLVELRAAHREETGVDETLGTAGEAATRSVAPLPAK
jgi:hypothetical protein